MNSSTELAGRLGITREVFPELFSPLYLSGFAMQRGEACGYESNLPMPDSGSPRACLWEPWLNMDLGWPLIHCNKGQTKFRLAHPLPEYASVVEALYASWRAKENIRG